MGKTNNKDEAEQPLQPGLVPKLQQFLATREGQIFPNLRKKEPPKTHKMIDNDMGEACIPKLVKQGKRDFHSLRNSYISQLADLGLAIHEVQKLARHSDIKTSQGYMMPTLNLPKRAAELLPHLPTPDA